MRIFKVHERMYGVAAIICQNLVENKSRWTFGTYGITSLFIAQFALYGIIHSFNSLIWNGAENLAIIHFFLLKQECHRFGSKKGSNVWPKPDFLPASEWLKSKPETSIIFITETSKPKIETQKAKIKIKNKSLVFFTSLKIYTHRSALVWSYHRSFDE